VMLLLVVVVVMPTQMHVAIYWALVGPSQMWGVQTCLADRVWCSCTWLDLVQSFTCNIALHVITLDSSPTRPEQTQKGKWDILHTSGKRTKSRACKHATSRFRFTTLFVQ
jgi:hypothetical protein